VVAFAVLLAGCGPSAAPSRPAAAPPPPPTTSAAPAPPTPGPPALAVKIDNVREARPSRGLGSADMVYVEPIEGGFSRILAVFASQVPPVVGPVRSARETDLRLLPAFGRPSLAFSGAAPALTGLIRRTSVNNASADRVPRAYFREGRRAAPHNMFVRTGQLPKGSPWAAGARPVFGPLPAGGAPKAREVVRYPATVVAFDWDPGSNRWLVSFDGAPATSDNQRLAAATVVVQRVPVRRSKIRDAAGSPSPIADSVGRGKATVLRNGQSFPATWTRPALDQGTTFTAADGTPVTFEPGQVWTVYAPG
jgi:hypothetical protein